MRIREVFARNLRQLRAAKGISQEELAYQAGLDRTYVSSLERCRYSVSIDALENLATALGTDESSLLRRPAPHARKGQRRSESE
jgi:transcriptional regulator with XRE-family HTH domain